MGNCSDTERALIAFWVALILLTLLAFVVSWGGAIRVLRAAKKAMGEISPGADLGSHEPGRAPPRDRGSIP